MIPRTALAVAFAAASFPVHACSIFAVARDGVVLAGNNEDYYLDAVPMMWVRTPEEGARGRVCFGFDEGRKTFAQGGLNDAGLFFDAAVTPPGPTGRIEGKAKGPRDLGDALLAACATVAEAIAWLDALDLHLLRASHLLIADAAGDAAVIELHEGAMKVFRRKTKDFVAATNFAFADPARGNYPCPRFAAIDAQLGAGGPQSAETFRDLLAAVAQPRASAPDGKREGGTLYSAVYDLKQGRIDLYLRGRFDAPIALRVSGLLAAGGAAAPLAALARP